MHLQGQILDLLLRTTFQRRILGIYYDRFLLSILLSTILWLCLRSQLIALTMLFRTLKAVISLMSLLFLFVAAKGCFTLWSNHLRGGQWSEMRFLYHFSDSFGSTIAFKVGNCGRSAMLDCIVRRRCISTWQLLRASLRKETSPNTICVTFRPVRFDLTRVGRLGGHVNHFRKVSLSFHFLIICRLDFTPGIVALTQRIRESVMGGRIAYVSSTWRMGVLVSQLGWWMRSILKFRFFLGRQPNSSNIVTVETRARIVTSANVRS